MSKLQRRPQANDAIRTTEPIVSDFAEGLIYPPGTLGGIVEVWPDPERFCVDLAIPDDSLVGGFRHDNVILRAHQFTVARQAAAEAGATAPAG